jgi:hypothetical protein
MAPVIVVVSVTILKRMLYCLEINCKNFSVEVNIAVPTEAQIPRPLIPAVFCPYS